MKTHLTTKAAVLSMLALFTTIVNVRAQSGTWTNLQSSVWSDATNWLNAIVATNADGAAVFSADLSTNDTANVTITVSLDPTADPTGRTIGDLTFADTDTVTLGSLGNWLINDNGVGLTLDNKTQPTVAVTVNTATGAANNLVTGWENTTLQANLTSTNALVKQGAGHLILNPSVANNLAGGMILSNGMVQLGVASTTGTANTTAVGSGPVIFRGGSLRLQNAAIPGNSPNNGGGGIPGLAVPIVVEPNQFGTLYLPPRSFPAFNGAVHGGGTLNLIVDFVRDNLGGDWSGFTGRVAIAASARGNSDLRIDSGTGRFVSDSWSNNIVSFTNNGVNSSTVFMYNMQPIGNNVHIGALEASIPGIVTIVSANTTVNAGGGNSAPFVLTVGELNTDTSFSGSFTAGAGSVGIIKVGTGNWTLNGPTVDYTGITVISNGVLQFGSGTSGTIGRSAVISNYSAVAFGRTDTTYAVTNIIDGPGVLIQRGTGRTTLSPTGGNNTYTGKTFVTNGTLAVANQTALGAAPGVYVADQVTLNGGSLAGTVTQTINNPNRGLAVGANGGGLGADGATILTVASIISGSGALTINNTGTTELTGANSLTGRLILQSGTLLLASESPLGAAPAAPAADQLTFNGGTLRSTATFAIDDSNRGLTFNAAGGTISPDAGTTLTISEPTAGAGVLTKVGAGTLVLNATGGRTGATLINQGVLAMGASGSSVSSPIAVASGATFDVSATAFTLGSGQLLTGNGSVVGSLTAGNGSTLSAGTSIGALTFANNLTLSGGATNLVEISSTTNDVINVSGNLTLSGVNTINLNLLSSLPVGTYQLIKYGGTLSGGVGNLALAGYPLSRLSAVLVHNSGTKSIDVVISGSTGVLVWQGGLDGNAWNVATTTNWLNGGNPDYFLNGDAVTFNDAGAANANVNLTGGVGPSLATVNSTTDYTFSGSGKLTGLAALDKQSANKLTILTTNDSTGTTTISGGTIQVGNGTASGSLGTGNVVDNSALTFNIPGSLTAANQISGTGSLTVEAGTVVLTGNNSYGASAINSSTTLQVGSGGGTGSVGNGNISNNGTLAYNRTGTVTNTGAISGTGGLTVQGSGTVVLAADNSYSGNTTVTTGTLRVGAGGAAGSLGTAGFVTLASGGTVAFNRSDATTNAPAIVGSGTLAQVGSGKTVITNDANSYGVTAVSGGTLELGDGANASGRLGTNGITLTTPGVLSFNRPDVYLLTNTVSGSGGIRQIGPTNLQITALGALGAGNTFSGGTVISNATLELVASATSPTESGYFNANERGLGTGPVSFWGNATLLLASHNGGEIATGNAQGAGLFPNAVSVPTGQSGRIELFGRGTMSGAVSGAGTLELSVMHVRADVTSGFTNFTGQINVTPNTNAMTVVGGITPITAFDFRTANNAGYPNAKLHLAANGLSGVSMYSRAAANASVPLGELSGDEGTSLRSTSGGGGSPGVNETWVVGGLNTDATFGGTLLDGNSFVKVGTGKWKLTGVNAHTGNTTISNGVIVLSTNSLGANGDIQVSANIILVAPARLDVTERTDASLQLGSAAIQTLSGNGSLLGNLVAGGLGTVSPGFSIGAITVSSNASLVGAAYLVEINPAAAPNCDRIVAQNVDLTSTVITVTNLGNTLKSGDTFQIIQASGTISGTPASVTGALPPGPGASWDLTSLNVDGTIKAVLPPSPTLTNSVSGGGTTLDFVWDPAYIGWRLYVQTNTLSVGLGTNWVAIQGTEGTTSYSAPIDTSSGAVFYRLSYP